MRLVRPERKYEASWMAALQEFEDKGINGFWNVPVKPVDITKALVTCNDSNLGSIKIIESNGGGIQDINEAKGEMVRRYWIEIPFL